MIGMEPASLAESLAQAAGWYGTPQARRVAGFIDARSESVGESFSRVRLDERGLPAPLLQYEVFDELGRLLARSDFAWPATIPSCTRRRTSSNKRSATSTPSPRSLR